MGLTISKVAVVPCLLVMIVCPRHATLTSQTAVLSSITSCDSELPQKFPPRLC